MSKVTIERFFTIPVHELYGYFMDPRLIERWSAPEGMTLKMAMFDGREGGRYRYEHHSAEGTYVCNGHFRRIVRNEMLRMVDDEIIDPSGKVLDKKLETEVIFTSFGTGAGVRITVSNFTNREFAENCEQGWNQCLDKLQDLVKDSGPHQFHSEEERRSGKTNMQ
jgi:uncharacterized protein YndB with AHSA1/START domain